MKKYLKPLNLQFFADGDSTETSAETQTTETTEAESTKEISIPKQRFDEVNNKYKESQKLIDQLLKEKQERETQEAEKKGEYEKLYQESAKELETYKPRVEQLESVLTQLYESKLEKVPEEFRDLIPSDYSAEQKLAWIDNAEKKGLFGKKQQKQIGDDTSPSETQAIDMNKLSPVQLLKAGYGKK